MLHNRPSMGWVDASPTTFHHLSMMLPQVFILFNAEEVKLEMSNDEIRNKKAIN